MTRYEHLAGILAERISQGLYQQGEKLPSVRSLSQEHGVSISTVQQAYQLLETRQLVVPQPRSGYFVMPQTLLPPLPTMGRPDQMPVDITQWNLVLEMMEGHRNKAVVPFSSGMPDIRQPTLKPLWRELSRVVQHNMHAVLNYDELAGCLALRQQIARLMVDGGSSVTAHDILTTHSCRSALSLALLAVCQPGDIVAVESPSYYGTLQLLQSLGLKVIEIPTDPELGISVEALELALEQWPVKGILLVPNCHNPLGYIMPDSRKRAVLALAQRHDVVIFEDDIYGELAQDYPRPRTLHSWDTDGRVLLCSSLTKTVAPGLRVGWVVPGRYRDRLLQIKYSMSGGNAPSTQLAATAFIRDGHYHRHIRRMRQVYRRNMAAYTAWLQDYFPVSIGVTRPKGGYLLWVELPHWVDMARVAEQLRQLKIQLAHGSLFSANGKYHNCLRLNCARPPDEQNHLVMQKVGAAVHQAMSSSDNLHPLSG